MLESFFNLIQKIKREFRLRRNTILARIEAARKAKEQAYYLHYYRPAKLGNKLAKHCKICGKTLELTREEFYSQFGEKGFL